MPLPSAVGELTGAVNNLANHIAACAEFQTITGAANAAGALEHIHFSALPKPATGNTHSLAELRGYRPYALIYLDEEAGVRFEADASDAGFEYGRRSGRLHFWIERDVAAEDQDDPSQADAAFLELMDGFISDFLELGGDAGYFAATSLETEGPMRADRKVVPAKGDFQVMVFHVSYGTG